MRRRGENRMCLGALMAIVALIATSFLCGCTKTNYVPAQSVSYRADTVRLVTERTDSVYRIDSVFVLQKGDTVVINRYREKWRDRREVVHDTTVAVRADTIRVPYPVEKTVEVEKPFPWWSKLLMLVGILALSIAVAWLALKYRK